MENREMKENPLNEKESLDLIARMIQNTQGRLEQGTGAPMLIWGYTTVVTTIIVWLTVKQTLNYHYNYLWFLIPVVGSICMFLRKRRPKGVRTYIDQVVGYIWIVLGVTGFLLSMVSILSAAWNLPILFIIIIIMGMGSTLTGLVTDFKPMVVGGVLGLIISILHYLIPGYDVKMLTFAFAFVVMYIIPGHILNYKAKKACLKS